MEIFNIQKEKYNYLKAWYIYFLFKTYIYFYIIYDKKEFKEIIDLKQTFLYCYENETNCSLAYITKMILGIFIYLLLYI